MALSRELLTSLYAAHLDELARRTAGVCERHGLDGLVLHSGTPQQKTSFDDQFWPLVTVPFFKHWLPLAVEGCALLVVPGDKPTLFYNVERGFWEGPPEPESDHFWPFFRVVEVRSPATIRAALRSRIGGLADDRILPPALHHDLSALRVTKTAYEVACLREANRRACRGHDAVLKAFAAGDHSELELHLLYLQHTEQDDPETPYKNIVALNEHAATLHHVSYGRTRPVAQSLLLDAGATFLGYDSDITRTAVRGTGAVADVFAGLVDGVDRLQRQLCDEAKAGVNYQALHDRSHHLLADVLKATGIAKATASAAALVDGGVTRKLLPHGLGHSLGLVTHDVGCRQVAPRADNPFLRNTIDIAVDQCFTIEPGCYFITSLLGELRALPAAADLDWRLLDALVPFGGVRVEDDLVVLQGGVDNLTRAFLP